MEKELIIVNRQSKEWLKNLIVFLIICILVALIVFGLFSIIYFRNEIFYREKSVISNLTPQITVEKENESLLFVDPYIPPTSITFGDDVGWLSWEDGKTKFEGDAYESARIFFDCFLIMYIDDYIEARIAEEKGLTIDEPEMILFEFATEGEFAREFRPQLFLKITNTDLSRCFIDNRLRIDLNGKTYWIRLEK